MSARRLALIAGALLAAGAGICAGLAFFAAPAPRHAFFERTFEVIAHRGGAALRPENTLAAFLNAFALGVDVLEMDLRATSDGAIIVLHDPTVDRTTDGTGRVASLALRQIQRLDAGYRWSPDDGRSFPYRGRGLRVPALEEVFEHLPNARMNLEMKQFAPASARALCELVRRHGMSSRVLVASVGDDAMGAFRGACPEVATSMTASEARLFVAFSRIYSPPALALQIPDRVGERVLATADLAAAARRRQLRLHVWTVNDEQRMRELVDIGVDGIITDYPDRLLRLSLRPALSD